MKTYQSELLDLVSQALFGKETKKIGDEVSLILEEANKQAVLPLAFSALDSNTTEKVKHWETCALSIIKKNMLLNYEHELLNDWMCEANVPYVVLKGCASASYYPVPIYRTMGDVDFFVPVHSLAKAGNVLKKEGLVSWDIDHISHIVYSKKEMHLEMHFNLAGTPNGVVGDLVRKYTADIFDKSFERKLDNGFVNFPSPFHHGIILLLHTSHHLTGEGIGLRHLCDWAVFENSFSDSEFCSLFEEPLKQIGLWKFAQILTRTAIKYLHADGKKWAVCDDTIVDALIEDIMFSGNFGRKDKSRTLQTMLISNRGKDGVGRTNIIGQFVESGNNFVYIKWPLAKKNKLLLPIGWMCFGIRRLVREWTGKRPKTNIKHSIDGAVERRSIYQQFCLFEPQD